MHLDPSDYRVNDLVCLVNARTQEVFTITDMYFDTKGELRISCGRHLFFDYEIEPKPLQIGDCVRHLNTTAHYEVTHTHGDVDFVTIVQQDDGHVFLKEARRNLIPCSRQVESKQVPSFKKGPSAPKTEEAPVEKKTVKIGDMALPKDAQKGASFGLVTAVHEDDVVVCFNGVNKPFKVDELNIFFYTSDEAPSFMVGDLVRIQGDDEWFSVLELTDGGRTVILGDGLEIQHTGLEPKPIEVGDMIRTLTGSFKGRVTDMFGDAVYFEGPSGITQGLTESDCRATVIQAPEYWPCGAAKDGVSPPRERALAEILAEIQETNDKVHSLRERRKALKKEARAAFNKALKAGKV